MPAPTAYTEESLAEYMHTMLGPVASSLGYEVETGSYGEAVNDALLMYGVDDIATVSGRENITRLRLLARWCAWKMVADHTAGDHDFSADGGSFSRSQINAQARKRLQDMESEVLAVDPAYSVEVVKVTHKHDPYTDLDDELRTP